MSLSLLDLIFPKKCVGCGKFGVYFCDLCRGKIEYVENPICSVCQRQAIGGKTHPKCTSRYSPDGLVVAARYKDSIKAAIVKVKYRWVYDIGGELVDLVALRIYKFNIPKKLILAPVPLHDKRKRWRGFNQAEVLARDLAKKFGVEYEDLLVRNRETKTQVGLSKSERVKNVKDAFSVNNGVDIIGRDLMLVDDVYTSGATTAECCKVLKKAGAKSVWIMAIALG